MRVAVLHMRVRLAVVSSVCMFCCTACPGAFGLMYCCTCYWYVRNTAVWVFIAESTCWLVGWYHRVLSSAHVWQSPVFGTSGEVWCVLVYRVRPAWLQCKICWPGLLHPSAGHCADGPQACLRQTCLRQHQTGLVQADFCCRSKLPRAAAVNTRQVGCLSYAGRRYDSFPYMACTTHLRVDTHFKPLYWFVKLGFARTCNRLVVAWCMLTVCCVHSEGKQGKKQHVPVCPLLGHLLLMYILLRALLHMLSWLWKQYGPADESQKTVLIYETALCLLIKAGAAAAGLALDWRYGVGSTCIFDLCCVY